VADVDPSRRGLEVFYGLETRQRSNAVCLVEAKTGKVIWGNPEPTIHVHGQGMVGDIIAEHPGMEIYTGEAKGGSNYWLYTASGKLLNHENLGSLSPHAVLWLDGPTKAYVLGGKILKYPREEVARIEGRVVAIADCLGDWREEIITALDGEIRIYSSMIPATTRRTCLMQDRLYRTDVAMQTMGYFYPPQLGGTGMATRGQ
jgi:rhamnogalacturonan endolyase